MANEPHGSTATKTAAAPDKANAEMEGPLRVVYDELKQVLIVLEGQNGQVYAETSDSAGPINAEGLLHIKSRINNALNKLFETQGICSCERETLVASMVGSNESVQSLKSIKQLVESRLKVLMSGYSFSYKKKKIKSRDYWYLIWWDKTEKRRREKYIGPTLPEHPGDAVRLIEDAQRDEVTTP